jgi:hypothetical protein
LDNFFGPQFSEKSKALEGTNYNDVILKHVGMKNAYRNKLPGLFTSVNTEKFKQLEDKLNFMRPAALPVECVKMKRDLENVNKYKMEADPGNAEKIFSERMTAAQKSPSTCFQPQVVAGSQQKHASNVDLMQDKAYLRRIKKANYGKWYLNPGAFEKKNKRLDKELTKHNNE